PWRERLRAQQVIALYRSGRQADALEAYQSLRRRLVDELGVEPSDEMRELNARVLAQDPTLLGRAAGLRAALPAWTSFTLPFAGRAVEELLLTRRLREIATGGARFVLVEGEPGIGKSRMVLEFVRRVQDQCLVLLSHGDDSFRSGTRALAATLE